MSGIEDFDASEYDGADYSVEGLEHVVIPQPDDGVAINSVTYMQGAGLNLRVVAVPGSRTVLWQKDLLGTSICDCSPPAIWQFTAISLNGDVTMLYTLDSHEALKFLSYPDLLFDTPDGDYGEAALSSQLTFIPPSEGVAMVTAETQEWITEGMGEDETGDDHLTFSEIRESDVVSAFEDFLKQGRDD